MEQIVFPVHPICEFLTEESKIRVFNTTEQDEQGSKVTHFFEQTSFLHGEMEWQKKLRSEKHEWLLLLGSVTSSEFRSDGGRVLQVCRFSTGSPGGCHCGEPSPSTSPSSSTSSSPSSIPTTLAKVLKSLKGPRELSRMFCKCSINMFQMLKKAFSFSVSLS